VARKRAVVLRLIAGEPVELVSREIGVPVFKLERWRERAEAALEGALKEREADGEGPELAAALQRIGLDAVVAFAGVSVSPTGGHLE